jgi:hypothetical protein
MAAQPRALSPTLFPLAHRMATSSRSSSGSSSAPPRVKKEVKGGAARAVAAMWAPSSLPTGGEGEAGAGSEGEEGAITGGEGDGRRSLSFRQHRATLTNLRTHQASACWRRSPSTRSSRWTTLPHACCRPWTLDSGNFIALDEDNDDELEDGGD